MPNTAETRSNSKDAAIAPDHRSLDGAARRLTGWCGIGMVVAIVVNGPLSQALQRTPSFWDPGAAATFAAYLQDDANIDQMVVFFALSNLIFVFAIGFLAGLRRVSGRSALSAWVDGVVSIGSALFLAGGLLSSTLSTGIAVVLRTTPDYHLDVNSALLLQGLWSTALAQGQVALGVVIVAVSVSSLRAGGLPRWLAWFGAIAGILTILRPALITQIPLFIASFQPVFLWIAAVSVVLLISARRRPSTEDLGRPRRSARLRVAARRGSVPAVTLLVVALLGACQSGGTTATPISTTTATEEQDAGTEPVNGDGCDAVSDEVVAAVLGAEVVRREPFAEPNVVGCTKGPEQTSVPNFVNVYVLTGVTIDDMTDGEDAGASSQSVEGVGDRAAFLPDAGSLFIEDGGDALSVQVFKAGLPGSLEDCVSIAQDMLDRRG